MPQTANARVPFGVVLTALKAKLVADGIADTIERITVGSPKNHPTLKGPWDILVVARGGQHERKDAGAGQFQIMRFIDVWLRSQEINDPGKALEDWVISTFETGDRITDSIGNDMWQPEDADGNLLLVEPATMVQGEPPDYQITGSIYGQWMLTISCLYMPAIDPAKSMG